MKKQCSFHIPSPLNFIENKLMPSVLPYSSMQLSKQIHRTIQSKIGGKPYLPPKEKIPLTESGDGMFLLIQINFAEARLPFPFPTDGVFQLYIDPIVLNNEAIPYNAVPQQLFETRYYQHPNIYSTELYALQNCSNNSAIQQALGIQFQTRYEPVSFTDYRMQQFIQNTDIILFETQTGYPFNEIYEQYFLSAENKVGGYPYFIEEDIRSNDEALRMYDTMLFQIVSNEDDQIMIGNCGIIKLFINKQALLRKDFSNVFLFIEDYT